jgi:hypothetical protein
LGGCKLIRTITRIIFQANKSGAKEMSVKKIVWLVSAICVLLIGLAMIIVAITGAGLPKPLWLLFAVCNLVNSILIISNFKKKD